MHCDALTMKRRMATAILTAALSSLAAGAAVGQQTLDRGTLVIIQGDRVVGREEFLLRSGRRSGSPDGFTLSSTVSYPADRPLRTLTAVVEFLPDSQPVASILELQNGEQERVLMVIGPRRVTVRLKTPAGESAREYPAGGSVLLADDSVFAYHALPPSLSHPEARGMTLRGARHGGAEVTDHGAEPTDVGPDQRTLWHVSVTLAGATRHLWYDEQGRLIKLSIPSRDLVVLRAEAD